MNKYLLRKYTVSAFSVLIFALCFAGVEVSAQILKPGEIIYSRVATVQGGNCDSAAIWAVGQDGTNDRFITNGLHPRISPDGRLILFKRFNSSTSCGPFFNGSPQWWIRDLTTKLETYISNNFLISYGHYFSPETNRSENQIIFDDSQGICRMNLDGTNRVCNFFTPRRYGHLSVRGGDNLVAMEYVDSNFPAANGLYTLSYDVTNLQQIPNTGIGDRSPAWSNDGQIIAYTKIGANRGANYPYYFDNLYKIKPDGTNKTQLTFFNNLPSTEGFSYSIIWTTDNSAILNAARLNGVAGIYRFAADGSGAATRIPITAGADPDWVGGIVPVYSELQTASFGGGAASSGNYSLVDTIGQAFAGQTSIGGAFNLQSGFWAGATASAGAKFDFDGDGKADVSVFRPSNGTWYLQQSAAGFTGVSFGQSGDVTVPADYDGDGKTDVAVFRGGTWYLQRSQLGFTGVAFGAATDIPVPADYDGDGKADIAVFRPSNGTWYLQQSTAGFTGIAFGQNGDKPVAADYDGDGKADVAVFRNGTWYINRSASGFYGVQFGDSNDKLVPADYDGDGKTDVAVFRPSNGVWYLNQSTNGFTGIPFGLGTDIPSAADYDGDGKADVAVFRNGIWYINRSTQGFYGVAFGASTDKPVPNSFVR